MRLLTKTELQNVKQLERDKDVALAAKTSRVIEDERKKLNAWRLEKENETRRVEDSFTAFMAEKNNSYQRLLAQITELEAKRILLSVPFDNKTAELNEREGTLLEQQKQIDAKETKLAAQYTELIDKVGAVEDEESHLKDWEKRLVVEQMNIGVQKTYLGENLAVLHTKWQEYYSAVAKSTLVMNERADEIRRDQEVLIIRAKDLVDKQQLIDNDRLLLASQQHTLKLAFEEARKKKII